MEKRKVKVVKRDTPAPPAPEQPPKPAEDVDRGISNAVKNWITERRKNSVSEKTLDSRAFSSWNHLPETSGRPA